MGPGESIDTREIAALRRRVKAAAPGVRKEMDGELRKVGMDVAMRARGLTPRQSGRLAAGWRPSVTYKMAVAIRNPVPYAGQHEYGRQIWLRRGLPIRDGDGRAASPAPANLPTRWVHLPDGRIVQEARYLIPRTAPGKRASIEVVAHSKARIEAAVTRAVERAL